MPREEYDRSTKYRPSLAFPFAVSLTKAGHGIFATEFHLRYLMGYRAVELYFQKPNIMGIRPIKETDQDSYEICFLRKNKNGGTGTAIIYIESFLDWFGISHPVARKYYPTWNEVEGLYEIDIHKPIEIGKQALPDEIPTISVKRKFEKFLRRNIFGRKKLPQLTISNYGKCTFNSGLVDDQHFKGCKGLGLSFDKERQVIGLRPYQEVNDKIFPIKEAGRRKNSHARSTYFINMVSFLRWFRIDFSKSRRYLPIWSEKEKLFEIDLNNPVGVSK